METRVPNFSGDTLFPEKRYETMEAEIPASLASLFWVIPKSFKEPWSRLLFFISDRVNIFTILYRQNISFIEICQEKNSSNEKKYPRIC